jgi:hypothetical protein
MSVAKLLCASVLAAACAVLVTGGSISSAAGSPAEGSPVYAVTGGSGDAQISRRNPRTLAQVGPAIPLGAWEFVAGLSPDGSLLALVALNASPASIRFLDVGRMRWHAAAVELPPLGSGTVRWISDHTVMVLGERPDGLRAVVVDAERGRIVRQVRIPGHLEAQYAEPTAAGVAVLLTPLTFRRMGPVLVGVIRPSGAVRVVEIGRVASGYVDRPRRPALIAGPGASRAYVFGGLDEPVAVVNLSTLAVSYYRLRGMLPLEGTLGSDRHGAWLAPGRIALVGFDDTKAQTRRLGLSLVDTRTWKLRRIDRDADFLAKSGELLLGLHMDGTLAVFGLNGTRRFSVPEQVFSVGVTAANGRYVYAYNLPPGSKGSAVVVDADARTIASWAQTPTLSLLLSPGLVVPGT